MNGVIYRANMWMTITLGQKNHDLFRINQIFSIKSDFFDQIDLFDFFNILDNLIRNISFLVFLKN